MSAEELSQALEMLAKYMSAEAAVLKGQTYSIDDITVTRADLDKVRAGRIEWEKKVLRLKRGGSGPRMRRAVPLDY